jgi:hypothetical protein
MQFVAAEMRFNFRNARNYRGKKIKLHFSSLFYCLQIYKTAADTVAPPREARVSAYPLARPAMFLRV